MVHSANTQMSDVARAYFEAKISMIPNGSCNYLEQAGPFKTPPCLLPFLAKRYVRRSLPVLCPFPI